MSSSKLLSGLHYPLAVLIIYLYRIIAVFCFHSQPVKNAVEDG